MATELKLSHTSAMILKAIDSGHVYGFGVMEVTGLPSGTVYPAMRRLERDSLIRSLMASRADRDEPLPSADDEPRAPPPRRPPAA